MSRIHSTHIRTMSLLCYLVQHAPLPEDRVDALKAHMGWSDSAFRRWLTEVRHMGFMLSYKTVWIMNNGKYDERRMLQLESCPPWFYAACHAAVSRGRDAGELPNVQ